jgi:hypothetical protein
MLEESAPSVVALAGRRLDRRRVTAPRFPEASVPVVRQKIADLLAQERAVALVSSAACGADLIGLEEADASGCGGASCCRLRLSVFATNRWRIAREIGYWSSIVSSRRRHKPETFLSSMKAQQIVGERLPPRTAPSSEKRDSLHRQYCPVRHIE